jgi:hypothetical protein
MLAEVRRSLQEVTSKLIKTGNSKLAKQMQAEISKLA